MKIYANNYTMPLEHPESSSPNPESIPNSCWFCGFAPEGSENKEKDDEEGKKCPRCGMLSLTTLPDDSMLTADPSAQVRDAPSSFVVNVSHVKQAVDFTRGLTPQSIAQLKSELQVLGMPLDQISTITRMLDDYRNVVQQNQQQMKQTQIEQSQYRSQFPTGMPAAPISAHRIKAEDIVKKELQSKIDEVVEKLVDQGADEDDAKEAVQAVLGDLDVTAALDKVSVWAEPIVERDYTPPLAESSKMPIKKLRKVVRKKKRDANNR